MKNLNLCVALIALLGLGACANMSALQTAETLPEGKGEFAAGFGYINHKAIVEGDADSEASAPYMEFQYRRGIMKNLDAGIKATLIGTGGADVKYQFIDGEKFDMAVGTSLAYMSISSGTSSDAGANTTATTKSTVIDWTIPLYMSTPVSETVTLYGSPKYMLRKATGGDALNILGATAGVKWGKESGVMVETSYGKALGKAFQSVQYNAAVFFNADSWL
ncbi:MAG: hypothetical protein ABIR96_13260 [Bdellovibrionota bacterium]